MAGTGETGTTQPEQSDSAHTFISSSVGHTAQFHCSHSVQQSQGPSVSQYHGVTVTWEPESVLDIDEHAMAAEQHGTQTR